MNLIDLAGNYSSADAAREFLEKQRWPNGAICPHCGMEGGAYRLESAPTTKNKIRPGVWKCGGCRKQFTVTVGTIFEDSRIPLNKWLMAIHLMCASKKGMSSHQLHRMLGVTYKSAWFMTHRIRFAMGQEPLKQKLNGTVEVDETYVGGKRRRMGHRGRPSIDSHKAPVVSLVQRGGKVRSFHVDRVSANNLKQILRDHVTTDTNIQTDDYSAYDWVKKEFPNHDIIKHTVQNYVRHDGGRTITTNTVEGFFSLIKRGVIGTFHHISKRHLQRYLNEFDFRYNARKLDDGTRAMLAIKTVAGRRLTYRPTKRRSSKPSLKEPLTNF